MITTTIIAVALGLAPVQANKPSQIVQGNYDSIVGRYSQSVDRRGNVHVHGSHPRSGAAYRLVITPRGDVEAELGENLVSFRVQSAE